MTFLVQLFALFLAFWIMFTLAMFIAVIAFSFSEAWPAAFGILALMYMIQRKGVSA